MIWGAWAWLGLTKVRVRVGVKLEIARASVLALVREPHGRVCPSVYLTRYLAQALGVRTTALRVNH